MHDPPRVCLSHSAYYTCLHPFCTPLPPSLEASLPGFVLRALWIVRTFSNPHSSGSSRTLSGSFTHTCTAFRIPSPLNNTVPLHTPARFARFCVCLADRAAQTLPSRTSEAAAMPQTTEPEFPLYSACVGGRLLMTTWSPASSDADMRRWRVVAQVAGERGCVVGAGQKER